MERRAFMNDMVRTELEDVVGVENVSVAVSDRMTYGVDYFWIGRMWADRGQVPPMPDWIVRPGSAEEVSKILKMIARAVFPEDPEMSMLAMDLMSTGSPDGYLVNGGMYSWSMTKYKQEVIEEISKGEQDEEHEEAWDELEKSIVANIADEIAVKVKDRHVEITIYKNF